MNVNEPSIEIDLRQYWLTLKRRWLPVIGVFGLVAGLAAVVALKQQTVYKAEAKLWFKTSRSPSLTGVAKDIDIGRLEALTLENNPLDTQAEIVRSVPVLKEVIKSLKLDLTPQKLARDIQVKGITGTDVLQITYQDINPHLAASIVNEIADAYIRSNLQSNRAEAASAREFIQTQLPRTEAAVARADFQLRLFREQNKIILLDEEAKVAVRTISAINDQIASFRGQLADEAARYQQLKQQLGLTAQQAIAFARLSQSSGVRDALTAFQSAQLKLAIQKSRFVGGPAIENLQMQVDDLKKLVQQRIRQIITEDKSINMGSLQVGQLEADLITDFVKTGVTTRGLEQRITELMSTKRTYEEQMSRLPRLEQSQRELERQLKVAQSTYETLLTRLQEVQLAENQSIGNARIISPAQIPEQGSSKRKIILVVGIVSGLMMGIATAFFLDLLDQSIKTLKQAKDRFTYSILGVIPLSHYDSTTTHSRKIAEVLPQLPARDLSQSLITEAYQMLQANLKFVSSDKPLKTIVITSSVEKEGKSEVTANLAIALSQVGRRVLLVDSDMRHPVQHLTWELTNSPGLTNVIVDRVALNEAVQKVMPNLWVLTSGDIPPNPIALLDSQRLTILVDEFSDSYDVVLFDSPPLTGIADAAVLGNIVDGLLLVVRPGIVDSKSAIAAQEFLAQSNQNVLGMVVNGVDSKNEDLRFYYNASYQGKRLQLSSDLLEDKPKLSQV